MLKYCAIFSLCAGLGLAGDYITGQAARAIIGQSTFTSQNFGATDNTMGSLGGLAYANDTLFVADSNRLGLLPINNRVLMFGQLQEFMPPITGQIQFTVRCPVCFGGATNVLGEPDFVTTTASTSATGMNLPLGVASDGVRVAVADTANNRVLLWLSFPTVIDQPADVVLGQPDFVSVSPVPVTASSLRAPQGVWLQSGKLYVADTQNNRVLIWNSIPTKNAQAADMVLGEPNFTTNPNADQTKNPNNATSSALLSPTSVSVSPDGTHLFIADEGFSRVLIWNEIPTANAQPADVEVGQVDMQTAIPDNTSVQCAANGTDMTGNPTFPSSCATTMSLPRFAISDGTRLYVADTGNDRVLVYETIPTRNGVAADVILGEPDQFSDVVTTTQSEFGGTDLTTSASNVTPAPTSLAWDGSNLYVADPLDFRVLIFTPAQPDIQTNGVVNGASLAIYAEGNILLGGTLNPGDTVTVTISTTTTQTNSYMYTEVSGDTFDSILTALANAINGSNNGVGDPDVLAEPELGFMTLNLVARAAGVAGNNVNIATTLSDNAQLTATPSGTTLTGGASAGVVAPGTLIQITGTNIADQSAAVPANTLALPTTLGGVQVYIDGIQSPLVSVLAGTSTTPGTVVAQVPFELVDTNSSSLYVRTVHADGSVTATDAIGLPIATANPGIFAQLGPDPRVAIAYHASSFATGTINVNGGVNAGDTATVGIEDRLYNYVISSTDTLFTIRDALIGLINANPEEKVTASAAAAYTAVRLQAKVPGPEGDGIAISATSTGPGSSATGSVTLTATNTALCCANVADAPITVNNPAVPGESIYVLAAGLGLVGPNAARLAIVDGQAYTGPALNDPESPVTAIADAMSATVISAGLEVCPCIGTPTSIGVYKVVLELNNAITTNPFAQLTISQDVFTSNIVTIPVYSANPTQ
jgi:hypothetical protein